MGKKSAFSENNSIVRNFYNRLKSGAIARNIIVAIGLVPALMQPMSSQAETVEWVRTGTVYWSNPSSWSTGKVPGRDDDVVVRWTNAIATGGPVYDLADTTIKSLAVGGGSYNGVMNGDPSGQKFVVLGQTNIAGGPLGGIIEWDQRGLSWESRGDIIIGSMDPNRSGSQVYFNLSGGANVSVANNAAVTLAATSASSGGFNISGESTAATINNLTAGLSGLGQVTVTNNGVLNSKKTYIGHNNTSNGVVYAERNGTWTSSDDIIVGYQGDGEARVGSGGRIDITDDAKHIIVASEAGSTGRLIVGASIDDTPISSGTITGDVQFGSGRGSLIFNHTDNSYQFASTIAGNGAVTNQAGTTTLTGDNTYTGETKISSGALYIVGDQSGATGSTNVLSGATLGGSGTIGGDVSIVKGGSLRSYMDNGSGHALTISGNLSAQNASLIYDFEGAAGSNLQNALAVSVGGNVDVTGATVHVNSDAALPAGKYHLVQVTGGGTITSTGLVLADDENGMLSLNVTSASDPDDPNTIELVSKNGLELRFWDAVNHDDGHVDGGDGTWQAGGTLNNWTSIDGTVNGAFSENSFAVFEGTAGTVTVDNTGGAIQVTGMQFITDGYTLKNGTLTLASGNNSFRVGAGTSDSNVTATIESVLAGDGLLEKNDAGTLILSGSNTYTGGTTVSGGILNIAADNNLGDSAGSVTINGGTVQFGGSFNTSRGIALTKNTLGTSQSGIDTQANNILLNGVITGVGKLYKSGTGTLTLSGSNTYSGGTEFTAGGISISSDDNLGDVAGQLTIGDANLVVTSDTTIARAIELASERSTIDVQANNVTISGVTSGTGFLVKEGTGKLTLSGANQHSGGTKINAGTLSVSDDGNLGADNAGITIDNATLETLADMSIAHSIELIGNANIDTGTQDVTIDGVISGDGSLVKKTGGTLTLTATNTFSGGLDIEGGTVLASRDENLGASSGSITLNFGNLKTTDDFTTSRQILLESGGGYLDPSDKTATYNGVISGAGALNVNETGTVILTGANSYTGATGVKNGSLFINGDQSSATGQVSVSQGGTLGGRGHIGGSVTVDGATAKLLSNVDTDLTRNALHIEGDLTVQNAILEYDYGADALHNTISVQVAGNINLSGSQIDVKATQPMAAGVYHLIDYQGTKAGTDPTLGNVPGTGYSLRTSTPNAIDLVYSADKQLRFWNPGGSGGTINGGDGTWEVNGTSDNWTDSAGSVNGPYTNDTFAVFEGRAGTVTVDDSNGDVDVTGMQFATDGYVVTGGKITLAAGENDIRVGDGTANAANNVATINSELGGTGRLQKADVGILVLDGTNTYTGGTSVKAGTLRVSADSNLGDAAGDVAVGNGTLQYAANFDSGRAFSVLSSNSTIDTQAFDTSLSGVISGAGGLVKKGSGTLNLLGDNSFTDRTVIDEGALALSGQGALSQSAGVTVNDKLSIENISADETSIKDLDGAASGQVVLGSKKLKITDAQDNVFAGVISGDGQVHLAGGTMTLSGDNSYTGGTAIDAGATLKLGNGEATGSIAGNIQLDGVLDVARAGDINLDNLFSGNGTLNLNNSGTTTLTTASPDFTGTTNLNSGQLVVNVVNGGQFNLSQNTILSGTGTVGGVKNLGTIKPGSDDDFGTFTIAGDYAGDNGTVVIKAALGDDNSASDMLKITGDSSGNSTVIVQNRDGLGAKTDKGIHIISIDGESNGVFRLQGDYLTHEGEQAVIAGAYAYTLNEGTDGSQDGNFYLRSELTNPPHPNPPHPQPRYNPAVPLYSAYGQILDNLNRSMTTSLQDRIGQRFTASGAVASPIEEGSAGLANPSIIWGRIDAAHGKFKPSGSTTTHDFEQDSWRLSAGMDAELLANQYGKMFGSLWLDYVTDNGRVSSVHGNGKLLTDGYGFGGAVTWYDENGWYLDMQGHLTWYNTEFDAHDVHGAVSSKRKALGYGLSAEFGQEFKLDENWSFTPQAQLIYSSVGVDPFVDSYKTAVNLNDQDSLVLRAGLAANYRTQWHNDAGGLEKMDAYVIANVYTQMLSQSRHIDISAVRFATGKMDQTWAELGVGATHRWEDSGISLFGDASIATGVENIGDNYRAKGKIGLKVNW